MMTRNEIYAWKSISSRFRQYKLYLEPEYFFGYERLTSNLFNDIFNILSYFYSHMVSNIPTNKFFYMYALDWPR